MADLTDRHYALFANNQHPLQLSAYTEYNRFLAEMHGDQARANEATANMENAVDEASSQLDAAEGETLSIDDLADIYCQVQGTNRARDNMGFNTRTKTGEINDYLEIRRPFGSAQ